MLGEVASRYRIVEKLGSGGMGAVFKAEDLRLHRSVALKVLLPECAGSESGRLRLMREARAASALNHPNIAVVYEIGDVLEDGVMSSFIAMEYVAGQTLTELALERRPTVKEALELCVQIADALAEAHARGVIHRDIKPSNVMVLPNGRVKVLDFGLATYQPLVDEKGATWSGLFTDLNRSAPGLIAGTAPYMSPEQALGKPVDARSDVFSLGIVLFELLAGRQPFLGENVVQVFDAILREDPPSLSRLNALVPLEVQRIVRKMLAKEKDRRYQSMGDVKADLQAALEGTITSGSGIGFERQREVPASMSVAVMTFTNITRIPEDDWLGLGIAETVTADLKSVPNVTVIGRERISELRRKLESHGPIPDDALATSLGRELGARWVLGGGYQRLGEQVRVTARVVEVDTGAVVQTVKLDGKIGEIFELQDRIVTELVRGLRLAPLEVPEVPEDGEDTHDVQAYEAYGKGLVNLRAETRESVDRAILFFERAVALDPGYARAHVLLGEAYDVKAAYLGMPELFDKARASFRHAIELRPAFPAAHRELGSTLVSMGREDEAIDAIRHAIELDPKDATSWGALARAYFIGKADFAEAGRHYLKALELNPQAGWYVLQFSHCATLLGDLNEAESAARRACQLQEDFISGKEGIQIVGAYVRLGHALFRQGRYAEALAEYEREEAYLRRVDHALKDRVRIELWVRAGSARIALGQFETGQADLKRATDAFERRLAMGADEPFTRYYVAIAYALLGELPCALDVLEKAAERKRRYTVVRARIEPDFAVLQNEPRFQALLATVPA